MPAFLLYLLIPAIGYCSWACARAYGGAGLAVFLGALLGLGIAIATLPDAGGAGHFSPALGVVTLALAILCGAFGVAKRRAALHSAGNKTPKSG